MESGFVHPARRVHFMWYENTGAPCPAHAVLYKRTPLTPGTT